MSTVKIQVISYGIRYSSIVASFFTSKNSEGLLVLLIYLTDPLESTMSVTWTDATKYDTGFTPSVAMNDNGVVVEVHMNGHGGLHYLVGNQGQDHTIDWGSSHHYDSGVYPCVAINKLGYVVEVHMASTVSSHLYCHVGKVNTERNLIEWGSSYKYDKGSLPKVAINDAGNVVTVHQTSNVITNALYYHTGTIDKDKLKVKSKNTTVEYVPQWH